ncbi:hypothetical protein LPC08_13255 [Roseomonas sp. OT10]|uniref:hypothetical protein n=1 Tax=Roseomonas cutis TaxID=2897332 RepID=UPI001E5B79B5|nr:hypothetical protein [Roseomonas sp. OT10]UFN46995.1 hypothetical protein LPC08_13255 [Roseomonas sp. OT10]
MAWFLDSRIPVQAVPDLPALAEALAGGGPAALVVPLPLPTLPPGAVAQEATDAVAHPVACSCCGGIARPALAVALDRLFQARVRGAAPWFDRVLVLGGAADALPVVLREDVLTAARYRPPAEAMPPAGPSPTDDNPFAEG